MKRYVVTNCAFKTKKEAIEYANQLRVKGRISEQYLNIHQEKIIKRDNGEYWTAPAQERNVFADIVGWDGEEVTLRKMINGEFVCEG